MRTRLIPALIAAAVFVVVIPANAGLPPENPWLDRTPLNIAHQGGAKEAPSNTLYAFKRALKVGADVLELDVHATEDGQLVVIHDTTLERTTNGTGRVDQTTLAEIKQLDAAYWWSPGTVDCHSAAAGACDWVFRGVATGAKKPPKNYSANDFKVPTLEEVLLAFRARASRHPAWINIEIKRTAPETIPYELELAQLLGEHGRGDDTIVVSFYDSAMESFKAASTVFAPNVSAATATGETAAFYLSSEGDLPGVPNPDYQALQVPIFFQQAPMPEPIQVVDQDFVTDAQANNFAVHVWTIDDPDEMNWLLDLGVNGIMTDVPSTLEQILKERA